MSDGFSAEHNDELLGLGGAYRKLEVTLRSPMMKHTYLRFFDRLQRDLNVVFVAVERAPAA